MPWKDVHQRINAKLSSMPESERQRYEQVRDNIMKEFDFDDDIIKFNRETNWLVKKSMQHRRAYETSKRIQKLTVLHDVLSMSGQDRYEHVRRNIMQSTAMADQGEIPGGLKAAAHNVRIRDAKAERSNKLHVLELLEKHATQPSQQAGNAPQMESVQPSRTTVNRPTEKAINVKTATTANIASMMNSIRKNMQKYLKTTADVGHASRDFFAGILRRKDAE